MKYLISYDLRGDDRAKDRDALRGLLEGWKAKRVLRSQWVLEKDKTDAEKLFESIWKQDCINFSDGLLVSALFKSFRRGDTTGLPGYASIGLIDDDTL